MDYVWEIEHCCLEQFTFEELERIICQKIASIIIKTEKENCTV